jgi:hypothetical protein
LGRVEGFAELKERGKTAAAGERACGFEPVTRSFDAAEAEEEAGRCLQCDLRYGMKPEKFWGSTEP